MASAVFRVVANNTNKNITSRLLNCRIDVSQNASLASGVKSKSAAAVLISDVPLPPNAPAPAYTKFSVKMNSEIRKEFPGISFNEVAKKSGEAWKKLTETEKKVYINEFLKKYEDYKQQKAQWWDTLSENQQARYKLHKKYQKENKMLKEVKDLNKPKRPLSAYTCFVTKFEKTKEMTSQKEWMQKAALAWKSLTDKEKEVYEIMAKGDAKRYEKEMNDWSKK